jgi:TPR repeat protein
MNEEPTITTAEKYNLAKAILLGSGEGTLEEGVGYLKDAAEDGNPYAQNDYAKLLYNGNLVHKDVVTAFNTFLNAALQGIDESQFYVGICYFNGSVVARDYDQAEEWFALSAEQGFPRAQYYLGLCFYNGYGTYKDVEVAAGWFRLAADRGVTSAKVAMGDMYSDPNNPERDYSEAYRLYKLGAETGDGSSLFKLGLCYYLGRGTPQNYISAAQTFRLGADAGDINSEYMLGVMYDKGLGVEADNNTSVRLLSHAAMAGSKEARDYTDVVATALRVVRPAEIPRPNTVKAFQGDEVSEFDLSTPDIIAKVTGANNGGIFDIFRWRKKN